jgi:hypothetical protein
MHQDILKIILALQKSGLQCDDNSLANLNEKQHLLLEMVKICLKKAPLPSRHRKNIVLSPSEISNLFLKILTADCSKKEAGDFLAQLFFNDHFYGDLHPFLQTTALPNDAKASSLQGVKILSDEQLLNIVFSKRAEKQKTLKDAQSFAQRFQNFISKTVRLKSPAFAAALLLIVITLILSLHRRPNPVYVAYFETPSHPYFSNSFSAAERESYASNFRSFSLTADKHQDAAILDLHNQLQVGLAGYLAKDYHSAVVQFEKLEKTAESTDSSSEFLAWQQEYYFYYGMAHLGLAGGKMFHRSHLLKAIRYLEHALSASESRKPQTSDEIHFFLGLAYDLDGNRGDARRQFQHISTESQFYDAAYELFRDKNNIPLKKE